MWEAIVVTYGTTYEELEIEDDDSVGREWRAT